MPRNRKRSVSAKGSWWSTTQKLEACALYAATGSPTAVCATYQIPMPTFKAWKKADWWKEALLKFRQEDHDLLDAKMTKIIQKTMSVIEDRVDNGNYVFNQKTGGIKRIPISAREATKVATDLLVQRSEIREATVKEDQSSDTSSRLQNLADEFLKFAKARTIEGSIVKE